MIEPIITGVGVWLLVSLVLSGLYLTLRWPAKTQDFKTQETREDVKNRRIARELESIRKGGEE